MSRFAAPLQQFLDTNCNRLANGSIQWYENGTVVPKEVWQDVDFTISQANPTPLDACGQTPALLQLDGVYTAVVMDSTDAVVGSPIDDVTGVGGSTESGTTAADILYTAPFTGAVQQTVKNRLGKVVYISDFDITPQPTGQRLEIQAVIDALAALNAEHTLVFGDPGEYNIDLTTANASAAGAIIGLIMPSNIHIELRRGSNLRVLANNADSYALILYPSSTTNSYIFGGGHLIGDISDHTTGTGDDGNLLWFAGCTRCGAIGIEANEAWGNSAYISEDDGTNDRSSEILLQDFINRSNRNNGILIDNSNSVDIINYKAFLIGQGASQSGTSDGIRIFLDADTTRIGNINITNANTVGSFGAGLNIDLISTVAFTDYGVNNINIDGISLKDAGIGADITGPDQGTANMLFNGVINIDNIQVENTQFASLDLKEFVSEMVSSLGYKISISNLNFIDPWQSNPGDALSTYISCTKVSGSEFANMTFSNIDATYNDVSPPDTSLRPTYLARLDGFVNVRVMFVNILNLDHNFSVTEQIFSTSGSVITNLDLVNYASSASLISRLALTDTEITARSVKISASTNTVNSETCLTLSKGTSASTANDTFLECIRGGQDGFIEMDAAGALSFSATASDRRLKSDYTEITGALEKLARVKVYSGKMAMPRDEKTVLDWQYQIADEMATEFPELVEGTQDAVDADGKPIYQRIKQDKTLQLWAALVDAHSLLDSQGKALIELESRLRRMENL